jgi:hypothetical protein
VAAVSDPGVSTTPWSARGRNAAGGTLGRRARRRAWASTLGAAAARATALAARRACGALGFRGRWTARVCRAAGPRELARVGLGEVRALGRCDRGGCERGGGAWPGYLVAQEVRGGLGPARGWPRGGGKNVSGPRERPGRGLREVFFYLFFLPFILFETMFQIWIQIQTCFLSLNKCTITKEKICLDMLCNNQGPL